MRLVSLLLASVLFITGRLQAQATAAESEVFLAAELDKPPRLKVAHIRYHPKERLELSAVVIVQFVVDTLGHPGPATTRVSDDPDSLFAEAATMTVLAREYSPGMVRGQKVRVLMQDAVRFRGKDSRCDHVVDAEGALFCADSLIAGH